MSSEKIYNKNFILLIQGHLISQMGTSMYTIGLIFWLKQTTESATTIGLFFMISTLPGFFLEPIGGAIADQYSRKKIVVICDCVNGIVFLVISIILLISPNSSNYIIVLLFIAALSSSIVGSFFRPAIKAAVSNVVSLQYITRAYGIFESTIQFSLLFGQLVGGILYKTLGMPLLILIDGLTYIASAFTESFITIQKKNNQVIDKSHFFKKLKKDTIEGVQYVRKSKGLMALFIVFSIWYFFVNTISVLLPFIVDDQLQSTPFWYGLLMASMPMGVLAGNFFAATINARSTQKYYWIIAALILIGLSVSCLGFASNNVEALILTVARGFFSGILDIFVISSIQLTTQNQMRGRILSLLGAITTAVAPISMGFTGIITDLLHKNITVILLISGMGISLSSLYILFNKEVQRIFEKENMIIYK